MILLHEPEFKFELLFRALGGRLVLVLVLWSQIFCVMGPSRKAESLRPLIRGGAEREFWACHMYLYYTFSINKCALHTYGNLVPLDPS